MLSIGGLGNMVLSSYSGVLLVAGGSGVTLALSAAEEIVQMLHQGRSNTRFIEVIWITQDMGTSFAILSKVSFSSFLH